MKFRTTSLLLAIVILAALSSAGCIWGKRSALSILNGAREGALESQTVHFSLETKFEGLDEGSPAEEFAFKAHGANDSKNKKNYIVLEFGEFEMEIRTIDGKTYTRFLDSWTESDEGDGDIGLFDSEFDPFDLLENMGIDDADVKHLGSGELHGKKADRYGVTLDPEDIDEDSFGSLLPPDHKVALEIWIDEDGMPARLLYSVEIEPGADLGLDNSSTVTFSLTLDLFDYGKAVDVEAPPADEIDATPNFGNLGSIAADPFEGADCYGDRLSNCLLPDPATDAMASNPDLCRSTTPRVCLVPVGKVRPDIVKAIVDFHRDTKGIEVLVLPGVPLAMSDLRVADSQVNETTIFGKLQSTYGVGNDSASTFIGITSIDIVPENDQYGWEFGYRVGRGPYGNLHGVFSYFRMANVKPYDGKPITDDLIRLRAAKYTARYTALLFLHVPAGDDRQYVNYRDMYGFSDLDSMGTKWPQEVPLACSGEKAVVCVIPDGEYADDDFLGDVKKVVERLAKDGVPVELFLPSAVRFLPTKSGWGVEFNEDLTGYYAGILARNPGIKLLGVSDDSFVQDPALVTPHFEFFKGPERVAVVSAGDAGGTVGTAPHQERLYRLMLRGILQVHYGMALSDDESSIMWKGAKKPSDLDGKSIPTIPR